MAFVGLIAIALASAGWMYCHFYLQTHDSLVDAEVLLYLVPITLGLTVAGILMAKWFVLLGVPLGWALFKFVIYKWLPK